MIDVWQEVGRQTYPAPPVMLHLDPRQFGELALELGEQKLALASVPFRRVRDEAAAAEQDAVVRHAPPVIEQVAGIGEHVAGCESAGSLLLWCHGTGDDDVRQHWQRGAAQTREEMLGRVAVRCNDDCFRPYRTVWRCQRVHA